MSLPDCRRFPSFHFPHSQKRTPYRSPGGHLMLFKSATGRNIFAIAASGLVATLATAGVLFTIAYKDSEEASLEQMRQIASNNALGIEKSMAQGMQTVDNL